jgi:hypothetical protein
VIVEGKITLCKGDRRAIVLGSRCKRRYWPRHSFQPREEAAVAAEPATTLERLTDESVVVLRLQAAAVALALQSLERPEAFTATLRPPDEAEGLAHSRRALCVCGSFTKLSVVRKSRSIIEKSLYRDVRGTTDNERTGKGGLRRPAYRASRRITSATNAVMVSNVLSKQLSARPPTGVVPIGR